jgi:hypothetical protein
MEAGLQRRGVLGAGEEIGGKGRKEICERETSEAEGEERLGNEEITIRSIRRLYKC